MEDENQGVTLIELMIAVAILGIITVIALPMYNDYIVTARASVMVSNIQSILLFQEERRLDRGVYVEGTYSPAVPTLGLAASLNWTPNTDADLITFVAVCDTDGAISPECARGSGYTITATHVQRHMLMAGMT
ncbi:MAG: prepilin-type N-terminal cleavage/methylation domain-containing protein [Pseudomonadales bacterium]|nr:prepilin-type N-terminal cleavage/methylation domain-containing protein [Pseudomonadales bacterium]